MNPFSDVLSLLLPRCCPACGRQLKDWEECLCLVCLAGLPVTGFQDDPDNPLAEMFWGRVRLEQAVAWIYFRKGSVYQEVMHRLKYGDRPDIGRYLGQLFGYDLGASAGFIRPDLLVPVPLNPKKLRKRGYNQSAVIAEGMAAALDIPVAGEALRRPVSTATQTRKSRYDRYLNVTGKFSVTDAGRITGLYLMLVDDVVTTGATLEACAEVLLAVPGVKVSVAALAWAKI